MIPLMANIPLALCSVALRRFIDSYTGRLPVAVVSSTVPAASTIAIFSGALVCLYHQLRKGTLVRIGLKKGFSSIIKRSKPTIQRRVKNNSWFLRNIDSCRRKCTEAVFKIVQPNRDSLEHIQTETGAVETGVVGETASLPTFNQMCSSEFRRNINRKPAVEKIFSNDSFGSDADSTHDVRISDLRRDETRKKIPNHVNSSQRPLTRYFRRSLVQPENIAVSRKFSSKRIRKTDHVKDETKDDRYINNNQLEERNHIFGRSSTQLQNSFIDPKPLAKMIGQRSKRLRKQPAVQKITRKTRSGRVYVYRL